VPEIVTDPEIPAPARLELAQAPVTALLAFGDPVVKPPVVNPEVPGDRVAQKDVRRATMTGAQYAAVGSAVLAVLQSCLGLLAAKPDLVLMAVFIWLPCAVVSALIGYRDHEPGQPPPRGRRRGRNAAVTYHRRYVVPELDLLDAGQVRWRRARKAARSIQASEAVRLGLIDTVEIAAVLPYHLWDIAERLALISAAERRLPVILQGVDISDAEIQAVLGPQRRVHDLAVADVEQRIGRLEEFAALAAKADAARKRKNVLAELAGLNPHYEELLVRLGEPADGLSVTGHAADELRAVAVAADDAVRRANEAGRALVIPPAADREPRSSRAQPRSRSG
jgi:hypothetical protein